jgi:hypothetical protein
MSTFVVRKMRIFITHHIHSRVINFSSWNHCRLFLLKWVLSFPVMLVSCDYIRVIFYRKNVDMKWILHHTMTSPTWVLFAYIFIDELEILNESHIPREFRFKYIHMQRCLQASVIWVQLHVNYYISSTLYGYSSMENCLPIKLPLCISNEERHSVIVVCFVNEMW